MAFALDEEEAAKYDRQIRVWGVEAQKRMKESTILVSGMNGLGLEVVKNSVLAGINVTLHDSQLATAVDLASQFYLREEELGRNRAEATLPRVKDLNPLVKVSSITTPLADIPDEQLKQFVLVVLTDCSPAAQIAACRRLHDLGIPCISATMCGTWAFYFVDFLEHKYTVQVPGKTAEDAATAEERVAKYLSMDAVLSRPWSSFPVQKRSLKTLHSSFYAWAAYMQGMAGLEAADGSVAGDKDTQAAHLVALSKSLCEKSGAEYEPRVDEALLKQLTAMQGLLLSPVCAVVGGVIGQDITKLISRKDLPIRNVFIFDAMGGTGGRVMTID